MYHTADISKTSFLITGGAGFIGSNIVKYLIDNNAGKVRVLDNLATGFIKNISQYNSHKNFEFIDGDIRNKEICKKCCEGIDFISHQAALGSVPRSIKDPLTTHEVNSTGFLNMIVAAKEANVKKFVYASTSAIYGDHPALPKKEEITGNPLSPYAVSKKTNELYARVFADRFKMKTVGLRYFNVFGPNQSPEGPYAAVIPLFVFSVLENKSPFIDGDGEQTRDFTYVDNVVQANIRAMLSQSDDVVNHIFNIATGGRISINELFNVISALVNSDIKPRYREKRPGDVRDSHADITLAKSLIGYKPDVLLADGLKKTLEWFRQTTINS